LGGTSSSVSSPNTTPPTRSPPDSARQPHTAAASAATTEASAPWRAKNIEMRWSTTSQVGRSRSSAYTRTWVRPLRALARQSMARVSSPGKYWRSSMKSSPRPRTRERWRPASRLRGDAFCGGQRTRRAAYSSASSWRQST
jgi:hypothetical protein